MSLPQKPNAPISYVYIPQDYLSLNNGPTRASATTPLPDPTPSFSEPRRLLLFINGLMAPQASWFPAIDDLIDDLKFKITTTLKAEETKPLLPFEIMTYDRYGQGSTTAPDPNDGEAKEPKFGHDLIEVVKDLLILTGEVRKKEAYQYCPSEPVELLLVGNSIGCPIIRLLAAQIGESRSADSSCNEFHISLESESGLESGLRQPLNLSGVIFLDSTMANSDINSILPDPADPHSGFEASQALDEDCTLEDYDHARQFLQTHFHPSVPTSEGIDCRNLPLLLPQADSPRLIDDPFLLVIGHDPSTFAEQSHLSGPCPKSLTRKFIQPTWEAYNHGLLNLVTESRKMRPEVVIAPAAGHYIQIDRPEMVTGWVAEMLERLGWV